jgi:hypothetical protein
VPDFTVFYLEETDENPTIGPVAVLDANQPASPAPSIPSPNAGMGASPHTPQASMGSTHNQIQWATPPTGGSADSDGALLRYSTIASLLDDNEEVHGFEYSGVCLVAAEEPSSVEEGCYASREMKAIEANRTWDVSDLLRTHKAIGLKWVFKVKNNPEDQIVKHKARLVSKGYAQ